jgi:hypothetical protein
MGIKITKCDDSMDGGGRAMSGTIAEARNAVNIGNIDKFRALRESVAFPRKCPWGATKHDSRDGGGRATSGTVAELAIFNSWIPIMTCSEVP